MLIKMINCDFFTKKQGIVYKSMLKCVIFEYSRKEFYSLLIMDFLRLYIA